MFSTIEVEMVLGIDVRRVCTMEVELVLGIDVKMVCMVCTIEVQMLLGIEVKIPWNGIENEVKLNIRLCFDVWGRTTALISFRSV